MYPNHFKNSLSEILAKKYYRILPQEKEEQKKKKFSFFLHFLQGVILFGVAVYSGCVIFQRREHSSFCLNHPPLAVVSHGNLPGKLPRSRQYIDPGTFEILAEKYKDSCYFKEGVSEGKQHVNKMLVGMGQSANLTDFGMKLQNEITQQSKHLSKLKSVTENAKHELDWRRFDYNTTCLNNKEPILLEHNIQEMREKLQKKKEAECVFDDHFNKYVKKMGQLKYVQEVESDFYTFWQGGSDLNALKRHLKNKT